MSLNFSKALFIFRRDLRIEDNTGLLFALEHAENVIPCFIFTPEQIEHNPYRSNRCLQFMIESLEELEQELTARQGKLYRFFGQPDQIVEQCIQQLKIDAVVVNRDYTPYSVKRDQEMERVCKKYSIPFHSLHDTLLHPVEETLKKDGKPYTVFTPFFRRASERPVSSPVHHPSAASYYNQPIPFAKETSIVEAIVPQRLKQAPGGRKAALDLLKDLKPFAHYTTQRDLLAEKKTTHLSAHLKFTTCSPREVYHATASQLGSDAALIRSLYWRDFFYSIAFHFPSVFQGAFHEKFNRLQWSQDPHAFERWCEGTTGFPIVDAGMREMQQTGYMHNRARLITASFLVKDLHIDWRLGERYFAQKLIDYDPSLNNGNWQWVAGTGCDAQPYFRIFNPWSQQKKFDPDALYIRQWIPELSSLPTEVIHHWYQQEYHKRCSYPAPLVNHDKEAALALAAYRQVRS